MGALYVASSATVFAPLGPWGKGFRTDQFLGGIPGGTNPCCSSPTYYIPGAGTTGVGPRAHGPPLAGGDALSRGFGEYSIYLPLPRESSPDGPPLILGVSPVIRYRFSLGMSSQMAHQMLGDR